MKRIVYIVLITIFLTVSVSSTSYKTDFSNANSFYEKGDFNAALEQYLKIESNISNWKLFYNIGNSYFKLGDLVKSKIYFLKAKRLVPFNESVNKNLGIIESSLNNNIQLREPGFASNVLKKIESFITIDILSVFLILILLTFAFFEMMLIKTGRTKRSVYGIIISFIMILLLFSYHMIRVGNYNKIKLAVVIRSESKLRSGPGIDNTVLFDITPGITVKIVDQNRDWVQVTASPEIAGWIESEKIEKIK